MATGEVMQQFFASEPATESLGSPTGEPYWNVVQLMEVVGETNTSGVAVVLFLGRFEALAPRLATQTRFEQPTYTYERSIKRMLDGKKVANVGSIEDVATLKEDEIKSLYINRSWAMRIRRAKLAWGGVSAMEVEGFSIGPIHFKPTHQAKVRCADGTYKTM